MDFEPTLSFAQSLDAQDRLRDFRSEYHIPLHRDGLPTIYFCGNSLGLQPKKVSAHLLEVAGAWKDFGVEGHFKGAAPWLDYHRQFGRPLANIVGSKPEEVVAMNTLTVNLHLLMASFFRPTPQRHKIIIEGGAFPSDRYAVVSQLQLHGLEAETSLVELFPRQGEHCLRTEDILSAIRKEGGSLALLMMGGVNYYTGQFFDLPKITKAVHEVGGLAGFDLAHAIGNLPLSLHSWEVDFATWCSYKYLNSGPGGVSGIYVHERHGNDPKTPRLAGWWGHNEKERFLMRPDFSPMLGAEGWQLSNAPIFNMVSHKAALELFERAGMTALREKSSLLSAFACYLIGELNRGLGENTVEVITPENPSERGGQLSLVVKNGGKELFKRISEKGVVADWREPNVIRIAPVPMYNTFEEVFRFCECLKDSL